MSPLPAVLAAVADSGITPFVAISMAFFKSSSSVDFFGSTVGFGASSSSSPAGQPCCSSIGTDGVTPVS